MHQEHFSFTTYNSPVGKLLMGATSMYIVLCDWLDKEENTRTPVVTRLQKYLGKEFYPSCINVISDPIRHGSVALLQLATQQLDEYFQGTRTTFDLPIKTFGTPFQQKVWQQLQYITYGTIVTYKEQAAAMGCPKSVRAVANANRLNALSIIIPCHRVIGTNHSLTGYAGGLDAKRWLINHEQVHVI